MHGHGDLGCERISIATAAVSGLGEALWCQRWDRNRIVRGRGDLGYEQISVAAATLTFGGVWRSF
jgi:hypothetical protein